MKRTTEEIANAYRILSNAKLTKMSDDDKLNVIQAIKEIRPIAETHEKMLRDIGIEKVTSVEFKPIAEKIAKGLALTNEERQFTEQLDNEIRSVIQENLKREHELGFKPLNSEAIKTFIASNDLSVGQYMIIYDFMCE